MLQPCFSFLPQYPILRTLQSRRVTDRRCCWVRTRVLPVASSSFSNFKVFVNHTTEDKHTIAIPLREKLMKHGIKTFVDEMDIPEETEAWEEAVTAAMNAVDIAVVVLSPEFVAREWPMKELLYFLERIKEPPKDERKPFVIIPFFYRLSIPELYHEPLLHRLDADGKSLYRRTRFFERMDNDEPEANIAIIQDSLQRLHTIWGIRNYVDASNDSSNEDAIEDSNEDSNNDSNQNGVLNYLGALNANTDDMVKRRNVLINDLCEYVLKKISRAGQDVSSDSDESQTKTNKWRSYHYEEKGIASLVFDFRVADNNANSRTIEADVLKTVLNTSLNEEVVCIQGIGGVGKTSLLQALSCRDACKERFKDGIHLIALGQGITRDKLIKTLCKAVNDSGGKALAQQMKQERHYEEVFDDFESWFAKKECLFMIDDVWMTSEITSDVITKLLGFHRFDSKSKVLFTTRSKQIATASDVEKKCFVLDPSEALGPRARAILFQYSCVEIDKSNADDSRAVDEVLTRCNGLPLFLKLAGKAVRALDIEGRAKGGAAYHWLNNTTDENVQSWLHTDVDSYNKTLASTLQVSLLLLEDRKKEGAWGFYTSLTAAEMHRRLSVLQKQSFVPMTMLRHLWELERESHAARAAKEFDQLALAETHFDKTESGYVQLLGLHDSLHEYALWETREAKEERLGPTKLIEGYGQGLDWDNGCRTWWSRQLKADGYVHSHLCLNLLLSASVTELAELLVLLGRPEWTVRTFELNGIYMIEHECELGLGYLRLFEDNLDKKCDPPEMFDFVRELIECLRLMIEAARLSSAFTVHSARELAFQFYGRLNVYAKDNVCMGTYVSRMESYASELALPWLRCTRSFLLIPDGRTRNVIRAGSAVWCMTITGKYAFCGCKDGRLVVVDLLLGRVENEWNAHSDLLSCVARYGESLLFTGSHDGTAKVWKLEKTTPTLVTTFHREPAHVSSIAAVLQGEWMVIGLSSGKAEVWEVENTAGAPEIVVEDSEQCVAMPNGKDIVSSGLGRQLRIWNATSEDRAADKFIDIDNDNMVTCMVPLNERYVFTASGDGTLRIWDVDKCEPVCAPYQAHRGFVTCFHVTDGGRMISAADKTIRVWDVASGEICSPLRGHADRVTGVSFDGSGKVIVSSSMDGTIRLWDLHTEGIKLEADQHEKPVLDVKFTNDGKYVVSGSLDCSVRIWDVKSGRMVGKPLLGHCSAVMAVAPMSNERLALSVAKDGTIRVWDIESQKLLHTLTGHSGQIDDVALIPGRDQDVQDAQGDQAVTVASDNTVRVWDLKAYDNSHFILEDRSVAEAVEVAGNFGIFGFGLRVHSVFVSDCGSKVVSASCDNTVIMWDLHTRKRLKAFSSFPDHALSMSREEIMNLVGETTSETSPISITPGHRRIWYDNEGERLQLAIMESAIRCWAMSPDKKTLCVGLHDGHVAFMTLET